MTSPLLLGLIGDGISASRTPRMHENEGAAHSIPTIYRTIDISNPRLAEVGLEELLTGAVRLGFDGLNITHPFKQQVIGLLDEVDPVAARINSVNTVVIDSTGRTTGFNTDVTGFAAGFRAGLDGAATEAVVQIGAGGAGRAVGFALAELGIGELIIADTDVRRAEGLAADIVEATSVGTRAKAIGLDELGGGRLGAGDRQRHPGGDEGLSGNPGRHLGDRVGHLGGRRRVLPARDTAARGGQGQGVPHARRVGDGGQSGHRRVRTLQRTEGGPAAHARDVPVLRRLTGNRTGFRLGADDQSSEASPAAFFCLRYSLKKLIAKMPTMRAKVSHSAYLSMTLRMSTAASPS